jgi:hypothetical protein
MAWWQAHWLWLTPLCLIAVAPPVAFRLLRKGRDAKDFGADRWATKADIKRAGLLR